MTDVEKEIIEQHRLIEAILRDDGDETAIAAFTDVLAPGFTLYMPDGDVRTRDEIVRGMDGARGSVPGLVLTIRAVRPLAVGDMAAGDLAVGAGTAVATYEEHHETPQRNTSRRSTVVFVRDPSARHGLRWRHLHETWMTDTAD